MNELVNFANSILWDNILIYLLLIGGLWFSLRLTFIQLRHFNQALQLLRQGNTEDSQGISSFQALMTSLAARVGTGNLAGVAIAISLGGPGAIFWMWVMALVGMATGYAESLLGQVYKVKDANGEYRGGPAYYIKMGLNQPWLAYTFSFCLFVGYGFVFSSVQANTITDALNNSYHLPTWATGLAIITIAAIIIWGGVRKIAHVSAVLVPIMGLSYLAIAIIICLMNLTHLPDVFATIFHSAFGLEQAAGGTIGAAILNGIKRGLYSNEAGAGTVPHAAAAASPNPPHPAVQGYVQMLGVFIDTIVICSATAFIILLAPTMGNETGIRLTQAALSFHIGGIGEHFVALAVALFAFTSIIANYVYAESNLHLFKLDSRMGRIIFSLLFLSTTFVGSIAALKPVWAIADFSLGMMTLINVIAIVLLTPTILAVTQHFNQVDRQQFNPKQLTQLQGQLDNSIWPASKKSTTR